LGSETGMVRRKKGLGLTIEKLGIGRGSGEQGKSIRQRSRASIDNRRKLNVQKDEGQKEGNSLE